MRLSLVVASGGYSPAVGRGLLIAAVSLAAEHWPRAYRLNSWWWRMEKILMIVCVCVCVCVLVAQLCPTLVTLWTVAHQAPLSMGILQARTLEWVAISFSRGSS